MIIPNIQFDRVTVVDNIGSKISHGCYIEIDGELNVFIAGIGKPPYPDMRKLTFEDPVVDFFCPERMIIRASSKFGPVKVICEFNVANVQ